MGKPSAYILAIDQGTTSTRSILFDAQLRPKAQAQVEFNQIFPAPGLVEHDPMVLWQTTLDTCREAIATSGIDAKSIASIGITNQRETTILWDKASGKPLHNALVWQDRRSAPICERLRQQGHEPLIRQRTGLLLDAYFSATKLSHLLDIIPDARARAARGELAFGTVDTWLIWNLTGGRVHATGASNAARTMLMNIHTCTWDREICEILSIPMQLLPEIRDCSGSFGETIPELFGSALAIGGAAGDQQAASLGQACFKPGMVKSTYGTGCFALMNTGNTPVMSDNRLLTTLASRINGKATYALEGSIFIAGAVVQWLRDGLHIISQAPEAGDLAPLAAAQSPVTMVPAFTGLGAPWWSSESRGAIFGLSRDTGPAELARAGLESVGFQTRDLISAMQDDISKNSDLGGAVLRVDGGMARSDWTMQFLADILGAPVDRPVITETTSLGAAWLAALSAGLSDEDHFAASWALERRFTPQMDATLADQHYARWIRAVKATIAF